MSFSFNFDFGYLSQTSTYSDNGLSNPSSLLTTTHESDNIKVTVYPRWLKHIAIEWYVPADWGNCRFNVYFSQVEDAEFVKINPSPINGTYLLDTTTQEYRKFTQGYYIVEAILLDKANASIKSYVASWNSIQRNWVELRSVEIQRREHFLLSKFAGSKTYLFRRRNYGERCPNCWSKTTEKIIKDHCEICIGTSFKGGYFEPATCYLQYDPTNNSNVKTYFGVFELNQIGAWTISIPEIRPDDVILKTGDWSVYRVDGMQPTTLQGKPVRQMLKLTQLGKGDIENELITRNLDEFPTNYT